MEKEKLNFKINYKNIRVFEEKNADKPQFPLVLSVPHSGTFFPEEFLQNVAFDVPTLRRNEDLLVDKLLEDAVNIGIPTIKAEVSRVFIDLNRDRLELDPSMFYNYPKDKDMLFDKHCRVGLGVVHRINYRRESLYNGLLDYHEVEERLKNVYDVYHKRLKQIVDRCVKKFGFCLVLDCHSMPSKICSIIDDRSGIEICLGNLFSQSCPQEMSDFLAGEFWNRNYKVEFNCPYSGAFITFNYCQPRRQMYTLQLEINRALYADEETLLPNEHFAQMAGDISGAIINLAQNLKRSDLSVL
ncbi:MAG: N-formylglutamate amidohydrolase [Alphaproteobacteria bacterium]|nr:N-formylglutamate amidohydrolase [Alphaproteobacteria bacterium]